MNILLNFLWIIPFIILSIILLDLIIDWTVHLEMNKGVKFISYEKLIKILNENDNWEKDVKFKGSVFKKTNWYNLKSISDYDENMLHGNIVKLNGNKYKLNIINYYRLKSFIKKWDLPYREKE